MGVEALPQDVVILPVKNFQCQRNFLRKLMRDGLESRLRCGAAKKTAQGKTPLCRAMGPLASPVFAGNYFLSVGAAGGTNGKVPNRFLLWLCICSCICTNRLLLWSM